MTVKQYIEIGADATAPAAARDRVADALAGKSAAVIQTATLLVSELVSNAVLHASESGDAVGVELSLNSDRIRIAVVDPGSGFDHVALDGADHLDAGLRPGGYGLKIVEDLAAAWGIDEGPPHKVWCELTTR